MNSEPTYTFRDFIKGRETLNLLLQHFYTVAKDIRRQSSDGIGQVYTLDFSELYAYMYSSIGKTKEEDRVYAKPISQMLEQEFDPKFILLPGAIWEVLKNLSIEALRYERFWRRFSYGWHYKLFINSNPVKNFMRTCEETADINSITNSYLKLIEEFPFVSFFSERNFLGAPIKRLIRLLNNEKLVPLSAEGINLSELKIENRFYEEVRSKLRKMGLYGSRPEISNKLDAYNFVVTYTLNEAYYKDLKKYFNFVTHSSIPLSVYKKIIWDGDPIVREPQECVFMMKAKHLSKDASEIEEWIKEMRILCESTYRILSEEQESKIRPPSSNRRMGIIMTKESHGKRVYTTLYDYGTYYAPYKEKLIDEKIPEKVYEDIRYFIEKRDLEKQRYEWRSIKSMLQELYMKLKRFMDGFDPDLIGEKEEFQKLEKWLEVVKVK